MEAIVSHLIRLENYRAIKSESRPIRILVAEDDTRMAHLMVMSLKQLGHNVVGAADNGEDLVELAQRLQPDLLIVDVLMPRMDGFDAIAKILKEISIPVIVSSGKSPDDFLKRAQDLGIDSYLVKPFTKEQLSSSIAMAIAGHGALLEAKMQIAALTSEIELMKAVESAVTLLMEKFRIDRKEALEKLETAARARSSTLLEAAKAISTTLSLGRAE
jgi:response regulator NasT